MIKNLPVGTKVVVTRRYKDNSGKPGMVGTIVSIDFSDPKAPYFLSFVDEIGRENKCWCTDVELISHQNSWDGNILKYRFI